MRLLIQRSVVGIRNIAEVLSFKAFFLIQFLELLFINFSSVFTKCRFASV